MLISFCLNTELFHVFFSDQGAQIHYQCKISQTRGLFLESPEKVFFEIPRFKTLRKCKLYLNAKPC